MTTAAKLVIVKAVFRSAEPHYEFTGDVHLRDGEIEIKVPHGVCAMSFRLERGEGVETAYWIEECFVWVGDDGRPIPKPANVAIVSQSETERLLVVDNGNPGPDPIQKRFYVISLLDGVIFGHDPIMVEEPPHDPPG